MPKIGAGLADISTKIDPLPENTYRAEIADVTHGKSKKSSVPMITVEYKLTKDNEEGGGRTLYDYFTLEQTNGDVNEAGLRSLKRLIIAACGEDRANAEDFDTDELKGQLVDLVVKQEGYEDEAGDEQVSNRVKKVVAIK